MKKIATINGVPLYSDKSVASINGTRVTFTDGSWCNGSTKEVVNRGPGDIRLGNGGAAQEHVTLGPFRYQTSRLDTRSIHADLVVEVGSAPDMEVTISGPKEEAEAIVLSTAGSALIIEGNPEEDGNDMNISIGGKFNIGGSVIISGNVSSLSIGSPAKDEAASVIVTVKVPVGSELDIESMHGNAKVGDVGGTLRAKASASSMIESGRMRSVDLNGSSGASISVTEASEDIRADASSGAKIRVLRGSVQRITAEANSGASIAYSGTSTDARLSAHSGGRISTGKVMNSPRISRSSGGSVSVG